MHANLRQLFTIKSNAVKLSYTRDKFHLKTKHKS